MQKFKPGDKVIYPNQGVVEVVAIESKDIGGNCQDFYALRVLDSARKIWVPVKKAESVGLRAPISGDMIDTIFAKLREPEPSLGGTTWHKRFKGFQDLLKTGDVLDVALVLQSLSVLKQTKKLSFGESQLLATAHKLIVQELAIAQDKTEGDVTAEVEAIFRVKAA